MGPVSTSDGGSPGSAPRVVVAAVALVDRLDRPTRVLAARRSAPASLAGGWEFPGGKVEPGEDDAAAAVRELREELGVTVSLGERVGGAWPLAGTAVMHLWWGVVEAGEPRALQDHDALRWLSRDTLEDVDWLVHDRPIVAHLRPALHPPG